MTKEQQAVEEFMRMFKQEVKTTPAPLNEEIAKLRAQLILEEAFETITKGLGLTISFINEDSFISENNLKDIKISLSKEKEVDLVELADGLADLHYVGYCGTGVAAGIDMEPIFEEVDSSNKTKMWTEEDLKKAKELYPTATVENYGGGLYRLIREDGKIIKSPSYKPADIKSLIDNQLS